jgi:metal-responsive CopG/Arc/MetJ family transcriptional regulator
VATIDKLMHSGGKHGHRNRSEFVRRAIERELQRCMADDSRGTNGA